MPRRPARGDLICVGLLLAAEVLLWAPRLRGPIDLRYDGGVYYLLGTSLAQGRGYRLLNEPGAIEGVQYPPALPALVAAVELALGTDDSVVAGHALRLVYFALSLACAGAAYALARSFLGPGLSLLAAALAMLHYFTVFLSDLCFAEVPFAVASVLFVLAARAGRTATAFALGSLAVLLRTQGMALLGAWVLDAALRRRPAQAALRAALSLVPLLLWGGWVAHVTREPGYRPGSYAYQRAPYQYYNVTYAENLRLVDPFRPEAGRLSAAAMAARLAGNLARLPVRFGEAVSGSPGHWAQIGWAIGRPLGERAAQALADATRLPRAVLGLLTVAGLLWLLRRREWLIPLHVLGSYLLIASTPWPEQFSRYLAPLAPFVALALVLGLRWLWGLGATRPGRWRRAAALARPAAVALGGAAVAVEGWALASTFARDYTPAEYVDRDGTRASLRLLYHGPEWNAFETALDWLRAHTEKDAVVATSCPQLTFLRTGRLAVMPPMEPEPAVALRLLDSVPVRYLVVEQLVFLDVSKRYAAPVVAAHPGLWELVYDRGGVRVFRRRQAPEAARESS